MSVFGYDTVEPGRSMLTFRSSMSETLIYFYQTIWWDIPEDSNMKISEDTVVVPQNLQYFKLLAPELFFFNFSTFRI